MDVEKRSSKGGFLHLFDWNVKSKKKLFSNKSDLPDGSSKGKENAANTMLLQSQLMETREDGLSHRGKISYDYEYASSMTSDEGYGTRAPGVVARLMGLDRLPTSNSSEPGSNPYSESSFVNDSYSQRCDIRIENHIIYNTPNEKTSKNLVESGLRRVQHMPIERFQTEAAPPRSAKSIPITHHRLLSPIKTPGFIPTNNVAYIMEAAAKIIEQGSPSVTRSKMSYFRSPSVPLRIKDLREKMLVDQKAPMPQASQRAKEHNSFDHNEEHATGRSHRRSGNKQLYDPSVTAVKDSSDSGKRKGKSVSLAVQAKVNIQRREGLTSSGNRSLVNNQRREGLTAYGNRSSIKRKEDDQIKLGQFGKNQMNTQISLQKRTSRSRAPDVLKQNDQKQNGIVNRDRVASKTLVSNQHERKYTPNNGCVRPNKGSNKVLSMATGPRKTNPVTKDAEMEPPVKRNASGEKRPLQIDMRLSEGAAKNTKMSKDERPVERIIANGGSLNWDLVDRKISTDVVSFTFTSPIKRTAAPGSHSSPDVLERNTRFSVDCYDGNHSEDLKNRNISSAGVNVVGGDALSILLEQKLKELTCRVESSEGNSEASNAACSRTSKEEFASTLDIRNTSSMGHRSSFHLNLQDDNSNYRYHDDCSSADSLLLKAKEKYQRLEETEEYSCSSNNDYGKELDCGFSSPISNLEPSSSYGSYESSDSKTSSVTYGLFLSEANGMMDGISGRRRQIAKVEMELSDSASSSSTSYVSGKQTTLTFTGFRKSQLQELEYIAKILCRSGLTFEDLVLGQVNKVLSPKLFYHLENREARRDENAEECPKLARKVLFDGVTECLESQSEQLQTRNSETWFKYSTLFRRKERLAEALYDEISSWESMGDLLVDELVDKDMSTRRGKWVDFEIEVYEEGLEIEKEILDSLVDELVADLLI